MDSKSDESTDGADSVHINFCYSSDDDGLSDGDEVNT